MKKKKNAKKYKNTDFTIIIFLKMKDCFSLSFTTHRTSQNFRIPHYYQLDWTNLHFAITDADCCKLTIHYETMSL